MPRPEPAGGVPTDGPADVRLYRLRRLRCAPHGGRGGREPRGRRRPAGRGRPLRPGDRRGRQAPRGDTQRARPGTRPVQAGPGPVHAPPGGPRLGGPAARPRPASGRGPVRKRRPEAALRGGPGRRPLRDAALAGPGEAPQVFRRASSPRRCGRARPAASSGRWRAAWRTRRRRKSPGAVRSSAPWCIPVCWRPRRWASSSF